MRIRNIDKGLAILTVSASVIAALAAARGAASWLEAVSFVTGAVCVWLTVKESVWNFPIGLANVATFCIVFFESKLFADAALQLVYFVFGAIGWWMWLYGGEHRSSLVVARASKAELSLTILTALAGTFGIWQLLHVLGGTATFWDALTTSISLAAQWLLNRKRLENWIGWIIVDIIYVPLYLYKHLYLTAILYAIFLIMAVTGLREWRRTWLLSRIPAHPGDVREAAIA